MNDDQTAKMISALANAFDRAAVKCSTAKQAALFIAGELEVSGFKIAPRSAKK